LKRSISALLLLAAVVALWQWPFSGRTVLAQVRLAANSGRAQAAETRVRAELERGFAAIGARVGDAIYLRLFKHERELELWVRRGEKYVLFRTYPICTFSGELGPKLRQGDGQAPEGFYSVGAGQLNPYSQFHLSFDLGYPNAYDRAHGRTGSLLMVHGSCVSIGCYAMGAAQIEQIYTLVAAALHGGQRRVPVHVFPFRFRQPPLPDWRRQRWGEFWTDLQRGYEAFERTRVPPSARVHNKRYVLQ
jgi:murein L,D-transpeptidase YafK